MDEFKKETATTPGGNEVSYSPERGGIITSIKFHGKEILYLDEGTFRDVKTNVRGGIPILFPNAGAISIPKFPNLLQHGFARNMKWQLKKEESSFTETLTANQDTKKIFPYDFYLNIKGMFNADGAFTITQSVKNLAQETMPVSMGLHPYFAVPHDSKKDIKFNFKGGKLVEENIEKWANGETVSMDNPSIPMEIYIPSVGTLVLQASKEYQKIWIWSQPGKDFICIEPVMRDKEGLAENPQMIKPGNILSATFNIFLKE